MSFKKGVKTRTGFNVPEAIWRPVNISLNPPTGNSPMTGSGTITMGAFVSDAERKAGAPPIQDLLRSYPLNGPDFAALGGTKLAEIFTAEEIKGGATVYQAIAKVAYRYVKEVKNEPVLVDAVNPDGSPAFDPNGNRLKAQKRDEKGNYVFESFFADAVEVP